MAQQETLLQGVSIQGNIAETHRKILTKDAITFLALLHRSFNKTRKELLQRRVIRQQELDRGVLPDFLPETKHIRENDAWKGAPPAPGLIDRRVEITGPTDRKMVVNALNSDVWTYMADFEGTGKYPPCIPLIPSFDTTPPLSSPTFNPDNPACADPDTNRLFCSHLG